MIGHRVRAVGAIFISYLLLSPVLAFAQVAPPAQMDDTSRPRIRFRGLSANPTFSMSNVGIDTNVFNSVVAPQRDFTATFSPALDAWARIGRTSLAARGQTDLVYFQKFASERSVDGGVGARFEVPMNRLMAFADGGVYSGRQRAGYEIDLRSRRTVESFGFGTGYAIGGKTSVRLGVHREQTAWDGDAQLFGTSLSRTLDRTSDSATVAYRQRLTVLTTFVAEVSAQRDRFKFTTDRNTDSQRAVIGFDLAARALIDGSARIGFRNFTSVSGTSESFSGLTASANVGYVVRGSTRLDLDVQRDTQYSYEADYPYYLQTGAVATLTQRLTNRWDVQARFGRQRLAYRVAQTTTEALPARLDRVHQAGGGLGYRLNRGLRVGVNLDKNERLSPVFLRKYDGFKVGASVTYAR